MLVRSVDAICFLSSVTPLIIVTDNGLDIFSESEDEDRDIEDTLKGTVGIAANVGGEPVGKRDKDWLEYWSSSEDNDEFEPRERRDDAELLLGSLDVCSSVSCVFLLVLPRRLKKDVGGGASNPFTWDACVVDILLEGEFTFDGFKSP